jgi:FdhD protein
VTMRTPGDDEALVRGFLFAEGLVDCAADVLDFVVGDPGEGRGNVLQVNLPAALRGRFDAAARAFLVNSACGVCGKASLAALRARARYAIAADGLRVPASVVLGLPAALATRQAAFAVTGGLHAAALFDPAGAIHDAREDVGRHNALDKLIGVALRDARLPLSGAGIVVSGRASFELVEKARMAGCPLLVAVGAPSSLAVEAAWDCGMTLVGFLRDGRFNVYATPARISDD